MPYFPNIPQPTDIASQSQPQILANFQNINSLIAVNHATFGTPNEGKHNIVTLPNNAAPTPTLINEASIFSHTSALTLVTELAWQRANNGNVIEFTGLTAATNGWTRLPSGILIKWGKGAVNGFNQPLVYPVSASVPVFTTVFTTIISARSIGTPVTQLVNIINTTETILGFSVNAFDTTGNPTFVGFSYISIGI